MRFLAFFLKLLSNLTFLICAAAFLSCAGRPGFLTSSPLPDDRQPIPEPKETNIVILSDIIDKSISNQIEQSFDFSRQLRNISGNKRRAFNADAFGEVPNSSWFTNRNGLKRMSTEEIVQGPYSDPAPDTSQIWEIFSVKTEGVTPGFNVTDERGIRWVIKFESPGSPELNTGAEIIGTLLFHAAGYNVPENYRVIFSPEKLRIKKGVELRGEKGRMRQMTQGDLEKLLSRVVVHSNGMIPAIASKFVPGKPLGPWRYEGMRKDDPNDFIPHQHRRELRGLKVIAAWLNHYDTKANNTLNVYLENEKYLRHYLIDFGSILGSQGYKPKLENIGYEESIDLPEITGAFLSLGFNRHDWETPSDVLYPAIGRLDTNNFHPEKYKFVIPNPAFELMTYEDAFWGAKIVTSFTDEQLRVVIEQANYSDPAAAHYMFETVKLRRDIIGRYWFGKMSPLDNFELRQNQDGGYELHFEDLAITAGLARSSESSWRFRINDSFKNTDGKMFCKIGDSNFLKKKKTHKVDVQVRRGGALGWIKPTRVFICKDAEGKPQILGLRR